jgi:predicted SnoaL-like aldol condensation-catalyzing enzyme
MRLFVPLGDQSWRVKLSPERASQRTREGYGSMSTDENKQLVLRWKEELWAKRNLNVIDDLCSTDYVGHMAGVPQPVRGPNELKKVLAAYLAAFDVDDAPQFLVAEDDMVVIRDTIRLKHKGEFQGHPATGKEATLSSTDIYRIVGGKIVEQWVEGNQLDLVLQLGLMPKRA